MVGMNYFLNPNRLPRAAESVQAADTEYKILALIVALATIFILFKLVLPKKNDQFEYTLLLLSDKEIASLLLELKKMGITFRHEKRSFWSHSVGDRLIYEKKYTPIVQECIKKFRPCFSKVRAINLNRL